jgi:cellulose 1,4-beta-cellobiosidase
MGILRFFACALGVVTACAGAAGQAPLLHGETPAPDTNPFDGARLYVNPDYVSEVEATAASAPPADGARLRKLEAFSTAIWLDSIEKAATVGHYLDAAAAQQAAGGAPVLTVFVLYNMPNRDCAAASSAGELSVEQDGERKYQHDFADPIAAQFRSHPSLHIVAIIEPDSLANVATNLNQPRCAASQAAYIHSAAYDVRALSMPNVWLYLDAAHAGWLGWDTNRSRIAHVYADVFTQAGGEGRVRGFATNVSNYNSLDAGEGHKLEPSDPCPDELTYTTKLAASLAAQGIHAKNFLIDTSRNGRPGVRAKWGSWCNVHGAGLGERPRASPAPGIDAYYWVKPPGESDGTSDPKAPRYDVSCGSPDSTPDAPQAGKFFSSYVAQLAALANPPL